MNIALKTALILMLAFLFRNQSNKEIVRMNASSLTGETEKIIRFAANFNDTIPNDTLYIHLNKQGMPVKYSREILTGVCIKGECRLVYIDLYWNITGRYLGFKLPDGEFLSKTEHVHFTPEEYDRLHMLLSDRNSALANYTLNELVPASSDSTNQKLDAVTSATISAVLDYIVKGAVYTTYTLWHIVHGPTKREIERLSSEMLNAETALHILNNQRLDDKIWVLNHLSAQTDPTQELLEKLMEFIAGNDVYLAERSLNAIKKEWLTGDVQKNLVQIFHEAGFLQQRLIIQKMKEAKQLNPEVVDQFSEYINELNGTLVKNMLDVFRFHNVHNDGLNDKLAGMLKHENQYIAHQALLFLEESGTDNKKIQKQIEKIAKKSR